MRTTTLVKPFLDTARSLRASVDGDVAERLQKSVIRPLTALLDGRAEQNDAPATTTPVSGDVTADAVLWELALDVTALCRPEAPPELVEAAAALQELALRPDGVRDQRIAELRAAMQQQPASIRLADKGPLLVTNVEDIHDWLGQPLEARPLTALCRCGASASKPYCDGSHAGSGFDDAKVPAASRIAAIPALGSKLPFSIIVARASTRASARIGSPRSSASRRNRSSHRAVGEWTKSFARCAIARRAR